MSKERYDQIIDEVYRKYADSHEYFVDGWMHVIPMVHNKETFVNECKTNPEFSEKWGLKIEERELSREERYVWYKANTHLIPPHFLNQAKEFEDKYIPTKLITVTYNNETIESYE